MFDLNFTLSSKNGVCFNEVGGLVTIASIDMGAKKPITANVTNNGSVIVLHEFYLDGTTDNPMVHDLVNWDYELMRDYNERQRKAVFNPMAETPDSDLMHIADLAEMIGDQCDRVSLDTSNRLLINHAMQILQHVADDLDEAIADWQAGYDTDEYHRATIR